ncbi:MAG TPA: ribosome maturation factor RimM [Terriglobia bacterium]|nr:ribosome maturation factor RimM [Terriglobia bacterium]
MHGSGDANGAPLQAEREAVSFLAIALIRRPQGRRGEVLAEILTDFEGRFRPGVRVYLEGRPGDVPQPLHFESAWPHKGRIVLKFAGVDSINEAERLRGLHVLIPFQERIPLPEDSYYWSELEGCRVMMRVSGAWVTAGTVAAVEPAPGVPLLHVTRIVPGGEEILIPLAQDICKRIDPKAKLIIIDPPEDLLDLNH